MSRKRVMVVGDKSVANTGFATYKKELLYGLNALGKYHLGEYAFCGIDSEKSKVPWDYIPCIPGANAPDREQFNANPMNKNGRWRWESAVIHWKPDVVISVQDPWQNDYIAYSPLREFYSLAMAAPVDSHPQKNKFIQIYNEADVVAPYTQYAHDVLSNAGLKNLCSPIPMGVDTAIFRPMDTQEAREALHMPVPEGSTVIGMVARNQPRKRIPELMHAFSDFLRDSGRDDVYLYLHTTYQDQMSWDLVRNMQNYGITDKVLYSYVCQQSRKLFAAKFRDEYSWSPFTEQLTGKFLNTAIAPSFAELNKVYNAMDLYVQLANAEGFCVPIIEAAATNTPIWGVNYSAYAEVIKEVGGKVIDPPFLEEDISVGAKRAVMPRNKFTELFSDPGSWGDGQGGRNMVESKYTWKVNVKGWSEVIESLDGGLSVKDTPPRTIEMPPVPQQATPVELVNIFATKLPNRWGPLHLNTLKAFYQGQIQPQALVQQYMQQINNFNQMEEIRVSNQAKPYWL